MSLFHVTGVSLCDCTSCTAVLEPCTPLLVSLYGSPIIRTHLAILQRELLNKRCLPCLHVMEQLCVRACVRVRVKECLV